jgi:hypothetical protein
MKNVFKHTKKGILIVAMMSSIVGFTDEAKLLITKKSKNTALVLNNVKQGHLISIKDKDGIILYKEAVQVNGLYKKGFDLASLPNGNYFFEIDKDLEINTIPFKVEANKVLFSKKEESTFYKPYINLKDDVVYVTKLSLKDEAIKVHIYLEQGNNFELVHTERANNVMTFEKAFKLEKGNYKIVINSNNKEYTKFVNN